MTEGHDWLDADGHFNRGKHRGEYLDVVGRDEPSYLRWVLDTGDCSQEDEAIIRATLRRWGGGDG
jgi:hypothetical protein